MEPASVAVHDPILVFNDEKDPEEMDSKEGEPADQPNQEE
jgi:hypothetical protein